MDILKEFSSLFVDYYKEYKKYTKLYGENVIIFIKPDITLKFMIIHYENDFYVPIFIKYQI